MAGRTRSTPSSGLAFLGSVVAGAGSLLVRHWPVLVALSFAGWAARTWLMLWRGTGATHMHYRVQR
jgi:hypothetical protein